MYRYTTRYSTCCTPCECTWTVKTAGAVGQAHPVPSRSRLHPSIRSCPATLLPCSESRALTSFLTLVLLSPPPSLTHLSIIAPFLSSAHSSSLSFGDLRPAGLDFSFNRPALLRHTPRYLSTYPDTSHLSQALRYVDALLFRISPSAPAPSTSTPRALCRPSAGSLQALSCCLCLCCWLAGGPSHLVVPFPLSPPNPLPDTTNAPASMLIC